MKRGLFRTRRVSNKAASRSNISFVADDRIDATRFGLLIEFQRTVQIAVIRQCKRIHSVLLGAIHQPPNRTRTVQQAVMAVTMQMNKLSAHVSILR